jgi:AcrR family transcriptional regulator
MSRPTAAGKPASNKREDVLAAAVSCFAARGLTGTGMRDVARAAGLTEGTLYHYFQSKDALIEAAFQWSAFHASDVRASLRRTDQSLRDRLLTVGADFLAALWRRPEWTRVVMREALRTRSNREHGSLRASLVPLAADRVAALAAALRDEMAAGSIRERDARRVADHFFRTLIGHFVADAITRPERVRRGADPFLAHLVDTLVSYLEVPDRRTTAHARRATRRGRR